MPIYQTDNNTFSPLKEKLHKSKTTLKEPNYTHTVTQRHRHTYTHNHTYTYTRAHKTEYHVHSHYHKYIHTNYLKIYL